MSRLQTKRTIVCPKCGKEYNPDEILLPSDIFKNKISPRNLNNKLLYVENIDDEEFICDNCDCKFIVKSTLCFDIIEVEDTIFDDLFESPLYEEREEL